MRRNNAVLIAILAVLAIVAVLAFMQPDTPNGIGGALDEIEEGYDATGNELGEQRSGAGQTREESQDAIEDRGDRL